MTKAQEAPGMDMRLIVLMTLAATTTNSVVFSQECEETLPNIEGPFYRAGAPERTDISMPDEGPTLTLVGQVVGWDCEPIEGAWIDFWQCDSAGVYDNTSSDYRFRGYQFADERGEWMLLSNVPAQYPGRPKHIHVKVQGEISDILTTQLYFPDDPLNSTDPWHDPELEITVVEELPDGDLIATYIFQLDEPGTPSCPADLNEDGMVNGADLTILLGDWGFSGSPHDLNGDDRIDGADLTILLSGWGECIL
jgi:protocatechuate 3,4-dioxygenase beta subunit